MSTRPRKPRIAVVGSANVDLTTFTSRFPRPGETIFGEQFDLGWGGKGANQAVAARLCGAEVSMVARVGDDLFGPATIENFRRQDIDTTYVRVVPGVSSGVAPIFVEANGQNRIIVVKGANDRLLAADIDEARPVLDAADCIVLQFEVPLETVLHTVRCANARGIRCILNPAPALPVRVADLLGVDVMVLNESEAEGLAEMPVANPEDAAAAARALVSRGLRNVIVTLGASGALMASADGVTVMPGFSVATRDTTGAGDAFVGSLAVFLAEGAPARDAVARANLYAALSTTRVGTQKSFVIRERFEEAWEARGSVPG